MPADVSGFKQNEEYSGCIWNLSVKRARAAIRKASHVYMNVILVDGGDGQYVLVTKAIALREIAKFADDETTTARLRLGDGAVFFN